MEMHYEEELIGGIDWRNLEIVYWTQVQLHS